MTKAKNALKHWTDQELIELGEKCRREYDPNKTYLPERLTKNRDVLGVVQEHWKLAKEMQLEVPDLPTLTGNQDIDLENLQEVYDVIYNRMSHAVEGDFRFFYLVQGAWFMRGWEFPND